MIITNDRKQSLSRQMKSHFFDYWQSGSVEDRALNCSLSYNGVCSRFKSEKSLNKPIWFVGRESSYKGAFTVGVLLLG